MPPELEPPELATLVDFAERPRTGDWSLRSSLVRYAQSQPVRVSRVIELVRRIEQVVHTHAKLLAAEGPALWGALVAGTSRAGQPHAVVVGVLRASAELDALAELLAMWADDRSRLRPDAEVDAAVVEVTGLLDGLGVPREERAGPPRRRG
ncbi:MAG: hypothetical protein ACRDYW_04955 [Acidimicrobiales bacterium]